MLDRTPKDLFMDILRSKNPDAVAWIKGNEENPQMSGAVRFFDTLWRNLGRSAVIWTS